jgi:uncharacterized protein (TIGR02145 family)
MKYNIYLLLLFVLFLAACSKNNERPTEIDINGKRYPTVVIGNQTWTAANYDGPGGIANAHESTIGRFYLFSELKSIKLPTGWRIPTQTDFTNLLKSQGLTTEYNYGQLETDSTATSHLKATFEWSNPGDNKSGFSALPSGDFFFASHFTDAKDYTIFWSSTAETLNGTTNQLVLSIDGERADVGLALPAGFACHLRFVKDN